MLAYDLDGVLIYTRTANRDAYRMAGVEPPEDFHQRPWQSWTDQKTHDKKNRYLSQTLGASAYEMPYLKQACLQDDTIILSACSDRALALYRELFPRLRVLPIFNRLTLNQKIRALIDHQAKSYYDDSQFACRKIKRALPNLEVRHVYNCQGDACLIF